MKTEDVITIYGMTIQKIFEIAQFSKAVQIILVQFKTKRQMTCEKFKKYKNHLTTY